MGEVLDILDPGITPARRARLAGTLVADAGRGVRSPGEAAAILRQVIDEHPLPARQRADVRWHLGQLLHLAGDAAGWREQRIAGAVDLRRRPGAAALVMVELAMPWVEHGRLAEHRRWLDQAVEAAARQRDPVVRLCVEVAQALIPLYAGDPAGWPLLDLIRWDAPSLAEQRQLVWAGHNLAGACYHLGHYDRARSLDQAAARRAVGLNHPNVAHLFESTELSLASSTGRWQGLESWAKSYIQANTELPSWSLHGHLVLGHLKRVRGEVEDAEQHLGRARDAALAAGVLPSAASASAGIARIRLEQGAPESAWDAACEVTELLERKGIWVWAAPVLPAAVEALVASRRVDDAGRLVDRFRAGLTGRDAPYAQAALQLCTGLVAGAGGHLATALAALDAAAVSYLALPRPDDAAGALAAAGSMRLAAGDPGGAEPLGAALEILDGLGATAQAQRVRLQLSGPSHPERAGSRVV